MNNSEKMRSQMVKTFKNMQYGLYFVHTLIALLEKYKLHEEGDMLIDRQYKELHEICNVQDSNKDNI